MREKSMKVVMCQLNTWVGDIAGNTAKVLASVTADQRLMPRVSSYSRS